MRRKFTRRHFLQSAGAAASIGAGLGLPAQAQETSTQGQGPAAQTPPQMGAPATPVTSVSSGPPVAFPTVLYGAAYYHEYEPFDHDRLDQDVKLMTEAGLSVVRMGESTWSLWEPENGRFEYAWMDRVVDAMDKAGIK